MKMICIGSCPSAMYVESFQRLLASRASFTVAIDRAAELVDDAIAVVQHLDVLSHRFRRVRCAFYDLALKTFRRDEQKVSIG